ncbi:MAG: hypothetical protein Q7T57_05430 [Dehalococcoidales bacterium]|nr:hypothetical protein [Dehalococcoidales bacterium]
MFEVGSLRVDMGNPGLNSGCCTILSFVQIWFRGSLQGNQKIAAFVAPMYNINIVDTQNENIHKSTLLYDAGGWFLITMFFGVAFIGVALDYFWNYLILSLTLRWLHISVTRKRKIVYIAIITAFGLLIDWLHYELTWGTLVIGNLIVPAAFPKPGNQLGLEISTVLIPIALIGIVNYFASRLHLHLNAKNALVVGGIMAVFTAPWLILAFVLLNW